MVACTPHTLLYTVEPKPDRAHRTVHPWVWHPSHVVSDVSLEPVETRAMATAARSAKRRGNERERGVIIAPLPGERRVERGERREERG